jgi:tRNA nucleotidyltransferase/poly(A) polymerase
MQGVVEMLLKVTNDVKTEELNERMQMLMCATFHSANRQQTVIRIAGGWVRDKLLGQDNDDIDIVISDMSAPEFAEIVKKHSSYQPVTTKIIRANPQLHKYVEITFFQTQACRAKKPFSPTLSSFSIASQIL